MELTFTQAAKGVNKEIVVNINDSCERCGGRGNEPGTKAQHCHYCNGTGMVSAQSAAEPASLPYWAESVPSTLKNSHCTHRLILGEIRLMWT